MNAEAVGTAVTGSVRDARPAAIGRFDAHRLGACIACGFCLPACPTYALTLDERSSPRGRISLMRAVEEGRLEVDDPAVREQASFCLGCRACEPVCPAGVQYGPLLEQWRDATWQGLRTPAIALPLRLGVRLTRAMGVAGRVRRAARPTGSARGTGVQLMLGCVERVLFPGVSRAVTRLLPGIEVPSGQGCCGALHAHNGASGHGARMARELSEYLCEAWSDPTDPRVPALHRLRVGDRVARAGLQDSCHARNALGAVAQPRDLIGRVAQYVELPSAGTCCGAAGTYSLVRPDDSRRILDPKLDEIEAAGIDYLVTVNPGCQRQVQVGLARRRSAVKVLHLAELLAMALGGAPGR